MDYRDRAAQGSGDGLKFDEASMTFVDDWLEEREEGEPDLIGKLPATWGVCSTCSGKGSHVNPSIDAGGLSPEVFREDPDFAENYFSGTYDQSCNECHGKRVTPQVDWDAVPEDQKKKAQAELTTRWQDHNNSLAEMEAERRMGC